MKIETKDFKYIDKFNNEINVNLYYVKFDNFEDLTGIIENEFVDIIHADPSYDLGSTKIEIKNLLISKSEEQKLGMVAEFFAHITLRNMGLTQQCLFRNLEDQSMKKGFDGLYELNGDFWLAESKSTISKTFHKIKISEAINDIKSKVETLSKNNPWMNAVHHMLCIENGKRDNNLKDQIKKLSIDYQSGISHELNEFNLIPISTLFVINIQNIDEIIDDLCKLFNKRTYRNIKVICIDNYVYENFIKYLGI